MCRAFFYAQLDRNLTIPRDIEGITLGLQRRW
jgi:hypothetical protein